MKINRQASVLITGAIKQKSQNMPQLW